MDEESEEDEVSTISRSTTGLGREVANHGETELPIERTPSEPADITRSKGDRPTQPKLKAFPRKPFGTGKNSRDRCFGAHWYSKFPFIEYSVQTDSVFCFCCRLFPPAKKKVEPVFTTVGYNDWHRLGGALSKHADSQAHKDSMIQWASYKQSEISGTVANRLDKERMSTIQANRKYLKTIAKVALLCARQDLALRGHDETDRSENKGNFREILELLASESSGFHQQYRTAPANAKYTSKDTQNDLLKAAAEIVLEHITKEARSAEFYTLLADECRDIGRTEQMSVCVRYICREDHCVKERFVGFVDVHQLDAHSLAGELVHHLGKLGLNLKQCISQCYDGASVMSGHISGVQSIIRQIVGQACPYIHCYAHRLNLVLVNTARGIQEVNNFFGLMEAIYRFFSVSTLRHDRFVTDQRQRQLQILEIPKLSDTRWVCRYVAVHLYLVRYECIVDALEGIVEDSRDRVEAAEATGLSCQLQNLSFVLLLCVFKDVLGVTKPLSDHLQSKDLNLAITIELVDSVTEALLSRRVNEYFSDHIWKYAIEIAHERELEIALPNNSKRRTVRLPSRLHQGVVMEVTGSRAAGTSDDPECVYRAVYFQVLDTVLSQLRSRFTESRRVILSIAACSPSSPRFFDADTIRPLALEYNLDMDKLAPQLTVAKNVLQHRNIHTIGEALHALACMDEAFPELLQLVRLALTFPVTTATAERSFSSLKRIKTYLRATMGQQRLNHLALLSIERGLSVTLDMDAVVDRFDSLHPRRIQLS